MFDKDLENKSSVRYKKLAEQVEQEVRKCESWNLGTWPGGTRKVSSRCIVLLGTKSVSFIVT